jgi:hypothetical protein
LRPAHGNALLVLPLWTTLLLLVVAAVVHQLAVAVALVDFVLGQDFL